MISVVAFIFAKGNSKGLKNKNLLKYKNSTLLGHAINQAQKIKYLRKKVFVSTDCRKVQSYAKKYSAIVPFLRPKLLATDKSPEIDSWRHAVKFLNKNLNLKPTYIISIPTTCPLRKISDLNKCLKKAISKNLDMVFTVMKSTRNPYFNMVTKKKNKINIVAKSIQSKFKSIRRRQDAPQCYDLTTACYVFKPSYILKTNDLFSGKIDFVEIPRERGIDIDDKFDYKIINLLTKNGKK